MRYKGYDIKIFYLLFFFFFVFHTHETYAKGVKIYITVSGDDTNQGTKEYPLASLTGALEKIKELRSNKPLNEPIEVIIGDGEYYMNEPLILNSEVSGTAESPVVFKAEVGSNPVFYGGKKIVGFEKVTEKLWRAKVPEVVNYGWYFEQLYVNGRRATRAKSPDKGFFYLGDVSETTMDQGEGSIANFAVQKIELLKDGIQEVKSFSKNDFNDAVFTFYHKWDNTRKRISGFNSDSSMIFTVGTGMQPWNKLKRNKTRYTIENYEAALDAFGEWYLSRSGYLYYIPFPEETIDDVQVMAPTISHFIVIQGDEKTGDKVKNIRFENLSFQVSGYKMPTYGDEAAQAAFPIEASVMLDFANNIQFINCEITRIGTNAIWFRKACTDCRVDHCYLHDLGAGGVKVGDFVQPDKLEDLTRNITIDNNIIRSGGFIFPCAVGVTIFHASDNQVTHNEVADFRYSGISVGWVWGYASSPSKRNQIEFNHIHHLGWGELCDMGGVYCLGKSEGTTVSNNVIHHVYSFDYGGWGLYTDEGSTGILMENNLVYNCKSSGFHQHFGKENIIRNNIFTNNMKAQLQATRIEEHLSFSFTNNIVWFSSGDLLTRNWVKVNMQSDNNCYWDKRSKDILFDKLSFKEWQKSGKDTHSIIGDPEFADPSIFDFRIKNKTVLRKTGFKEFDYSRAGVYGTDKWEKLAEFDTELVQQFDEVILRNENKIYVSTRGKDSGDGTMKNPFSTIEKARDVIRNKRQAGIKYPASIILREGDYYFSNTLEFDEQDKDVTISAFNEEKVRFTGGISIDPAKAIPVAGSEKEMVFPKINRSHIFMVNLKELGITNYGKLSQFGQQHPDVPSWMELFINGEPCYLSRWPNNSKVKIEKIINEGSNASEGDSGNIGGEFTYSGNRPSQWKTSENIWIYGYFHYGWADDAMKLASIDTIKKIFTTSKPHRYGFSAKRSWNSWFAYNIPEEIDTIGEYYIDQHEGVLYFYNPGKIEQLQVSLLEEPLIEMNKASNIRIVGVSFECARGIAVEIKNSEQCRLSNCMFRNFGMNAVNIGDDDDGIVGKKNGLEDCAIFQTGAGGVHLFGGNRKTLEAAENYVKNCSIHNFNRISKMYRAGVQISGVGNQISHCEIFNAPHVAILLNGNNHLMEYNNIHNVCLDTDDAGAIYYGRNPSERGHVVQYNYFHHLGEKHRISAVYHDDGACGMEVFGNVFYKAGTKTLFIHGGSDNVYRNNIFIDCPVAIEINNTYHTSGSGKKAHAPGGLFEKLLNEVNYNKPPYSIRYPRLANYWDNEAHPKRNFADKNVFVRVAEAVKIKSDTKILENSGNNFETTLDPGFINEKNQNFKLNQSSEVFDKIPGFHQIPFENIGIVK